MPGLRAGDFVAFADGHRTRRPASTVSAITSTAGISRRRRGDPTTWPSRAVHKRAVRAEPALLGGLGGDATFRGGLLDPITRLSAGD